MRARSSTSSTPALRTTTFPPRRSISSSRAGTLSRRSTERAGCPGVRRTPRSSRRAAGCRRTSGPAAGRDGSRSVTPRDASTSSADSKVIWLDITVPVRISSAVRSETSVTAQPCCSRPSASVVPAGPAPTTATDRDREGVCCMLPASHSPRTAESTTGQAGDSGSITAKWSVPSSTRRSTNGCRRASPRVPDGDLHVVGAVHDGHRAGRAVREPGRRVGRVVPLGHLVEGAAEERLDRPVAEPGGRRRAQVPDRGEGDHRCEAAARSPITGPGARRRSARPWSWSPGPPARRAAQAAQP